MSLPLLNRNFIPKHLGPQKTIDDNPGKRTHESATLGTKMDAAKNTSTRPWWLAGNLLAAWHTKASIKDVESDLILNSSY